MISILILDNYDSFTYNLVQMVQGLAHRLHTGETVVVHRNNAISFDEILQLHPSRVLISPGPGHPAVPSDFGVCREVIERQPELDCPVIGVCLGHQGIADVFGGSVVRAPEIVHGKSSLIRWHERGRSLFDGLDNPFEAMRYHSLVVQESDFPEDLEILARLETDTIETSLIMALRHKSRPIFGVQFHPESIGTPQGERLLANLLSLKPDS